jgi:hypothetical protein
MLLLAVKEKILMNIKAKQTKTGEKREGKKKYQTPRLRTEKIFERNALACGKTDPQTSPCLISLKLS